MNVSQRPSSGPAGLVDLAAVALMLAAGLVGFAPSFVTLAYAPATAGGAVLGLALAWTAVRHGWSVVTTAAATVAVYVLAGGPLALAATTRFGVVPTAETLRQLLRGAVESWKGWLTVAPPLDAFPELLVVPFLAALVFSVLSGSLALLPRRYAWALLPTAALLVGVILLGTTDTVAPVAQGLAFGVVALTWLGWRRARGRTAVRQLVGSSDQDAELRVSRALHARRLRNSVVMLTGATLVAALAAPVLAPSAGRHVLRESVVPRLDVRDYTSPLVGFRHYVKDLEDEVLFTVDGLPAGGRVRLAVLDAYTGTVMDVAGGAPGAPAGSGFFAPGGEAVPASSAARAAGSTVQIEIEAYDGVWLPTVGRPSRIRFEGERASTLHDGLYYNAATGIAIATGGLREGDRFALQTDVPDEPAVEDLAGRSFDRLDLPKPSVVPPSVDVLAHHFAGDAATPIEQVRKLEEALATTGVLSNGLEGQARSHPGHGAARIEELLSGREMVGDDEQYAVAMALMAQRLGIPARVVMGFYPAEDAVAEGPVEIKGTDVHAWVEVAFDGVGWVPFDPTPDEDREPQETDPRSSSEPEPQVLQEPPQPEELSEPPLDTRPEAADPEKEDRGGIPWLHYLGLAAMVAVPLALLLSPFLLIAALKARRRRRRLVAEEPVERVTGGWREVVDCAVDLGTRVPPGATRRETARRLQEQFSVAQPVTVAERADAVVFGSGEPTDAEIAAFWAEVDQLVADISGSVTRWQRLRARFSPQSLHPRGMPRPSRPGGLR